MWLALNEGQATALQALLDGKYDVNRRHTNLETPLHLAIRLGDVATAMKLLVAGASATVPGGKLPACPTHRKGFFCIWIVFHFFDTLGSELCSHVLTVSFALHAHGRN